jgi:hypothetical protein
MDNINLTGELDLEKEKKLKLEMILENTSHEEQLGATQESFVQGYMTPSYSFVLPLELFACHLCGSKMVVFRLNS